MPPSSLRGFVGSSLQSRSRNPNSKNGSSSSSSWAVDGRDAHPAGGYQYALNYTDCYGTSGAEWRIGCDKCCANAEACWPNDHVLGYWYHEWGPGYDDEWTEYPDTCLPWPTPTWEDCIQNCQSAKCHMMSRKSGFSHYRGGHQCPCEKNYTEDTVCDGYINDMEASPGCGY